MQTSCKCEAMDSQNPQKPVTGILFQLIKSTNLSVDLYHPQMWPE